MDGLYELAMFTAWHVAMFSRAVKLPSLKSVLGKMRKKTTPTPTRKQQRSVLYQVAGQLGLEVKRVPKNKP